MKKGKIEKEDKAGFDLVKTRMFDKWDNFRKQESLNAYLDAGYSEVRFLWDTFHATKTKIGDGIGMDGEVLWYAFGHDDHITTALRAIWGQYVSKGE